MKQREIKFRGKRVDNGEWVYGCLVNNLWLYNIDGVSKFGIANGTKVCEIITGDYEGDCWEDIIDEEKTIVTVITESVGQFIGLLDKNGKEIYEGDICKISDPYDENEKVFIVEYKNGGFTVEWDSMFCGGADCTTIGWAIDSEFTIEVIGNIYENENLLKRKD